MKKLLTEVVSPVAMGLMVHTHGMDQPDSPVSSGWTMANDLEKMRNAAMLARNSDWQTDTTESDGPTIPSAVVNNKILEFLETLALAMHDYTNMKDHPAINTSTDGAQQYQNKEFHGYSQGVKPHSPGEEKQIYQKMSNLFNSVEISNNGDVLVEVSNVANIQFAGRLYEATISVRGTQTNIKVFYPSSRVISRTRLQEDLNKAIPNVVVLNFKAMESPSRISNIPVAFLTEWHREVNIFEKLVHEFSPGCFFINTLNFSIEPEQTKTFSKPQKLLESYSKVVQKISIDQV